MNHANLDVIVVGAGPAGLSSSYYLTQHSITHLVFEKGTVGESWRSQRWQSFKLNTANKLNMLPGTSYPGKDPDGFSTHTAFVAYLKTYVARFKLPVVEHATVVSIAKNEESGRFDVKVAQHPGIAEFTCRKIIIASGDMNRKKLPSFADHVPSGIRQLHASEYRNAKDLPDGSVLVVGGGQSGCQITEDLLESGRKVYLSSSAVPRIPRRYRGRDIMDWLIETKFMDVKTRDVPDPKMLTTPVPLLSGTGMLGHTISLQFLAGKGAVIAGKLHDCTGSHVFFENNAAMHVKFADGISEKLKATIDAYIIQANVEAPAAEDDPADKPDPDAACTSSITEMDLEKHEVTSIIWATGFTSDYSYIKMPVSGNGSHLIHENGILAGGLYLVGYRWLRSRKSSLIYGIANDAGFITAELIKALRKPGEGSYATAGELNHHH